MMTVGELIEKLETMDRKKVVVFNDITPPYTSRWCENINIDYKYRLIPVVKDNKRVCAYRKVVLIEHD